MYRPLALSQSPLPSSYDSSIMHTPVQKDHGHGSLSGMLALAKHTSSIQHLLHYPSSPLYFPSTSPKKSSRILTISENVRIVMDKRIKEENAEIKNKNNWSLLYLGVSLKLSIQSHFAILSFLRIFLHHLPLLLCALVPQSVARLLKTMCLATN